MKKVLLIVLSLSLANATTLTTLFNKLKQNAHTKSDILAILQSRVNQKAIEAKLYPKLNLKLSANHYTFNNALRPLTPKESKLLANSPQPFGHNIYKETIIFSMPIYVKSIYTLEESAKVMQLSQRAKKRLNLIKNQALIVGADANLRYLEELEGALKHKKQRLLTIKRITKKAIKLGRLPESELFKIDDKISQIDISQLDIKLSKEKLKESINSLTGLYLKHSVAIKKVQKIRKNSFLALQPLKIALRANYLRAKAAKEQRYPTVTMHSSYTLSQTNAYNTDSLVHENYGSIGIDANIPLYNRELNENIELKKLEVLKSKIVIKKIEDELKAKAKRLQKSLIMLYKEKRYYAKSIKNKRRLLNIARVSYENQMMSIEEYLRYQDDLIYQEANIFKVKAKITETQAQLAMLYGNNLERIFR